MQETVGGSAEAAPRLYTRRSSGLVREMSGTAALMGSVCIVNLPIAAVTLMLLPFAFPGASMPLSVLISLIPAAILGGVYILFGIMMPRSGGDYVFNGRALHPSVGFAANFNFVVCNLLFAGIEAVLWLAGTKTLAQERDPTLGFSGLTLFERDRGRGVFVTSPRAMRHSVNYQEFALEKPAFRSPDHCIGVRTPFRSPRYTLSPMPISSP